MAKQEIFQLNALTRQKSLSTLSQAAHQARVLQDMKPTAVAAQNFWDYPELFEASGGETVFTIIGYTAWTAMEGHAPPYCKSPYYIQSIEPRH